MDSRHLSCCILFLALSCQYGMSYRIYILPQQGDFCLGVFSGDACFTWSEYSARPTFADHSTTLIFTRGTYNLNRYGPFTVSNIKSLTLIGDGALLQFQLLFSSIGDVNMHNLTLASSPRVNVRNVQSFLMENCTFIITQSSTSVYSSQPVGLYLYRSDMNRIVGSTFVQVPVDAQSSSTLLVIRSSFSNSSSSCIKGDSSSNVTIRSSSFVNNYVSNSYRYYSYGIVYTRSSLEIIDCLFDRNSASGRGAVVYSYGDVSVTNSNFTKNEAVYLYRRPSTYRYYRGGYAIWGQQNIYIDNCTFSYYTGSSSVIYSYQYYYYSRMSYPIDVINSRFYHSSRSIYSYGNVTIMDTDFYNITVNSGGGGAVYTTGSIMALNCMFYNSTALYGSGGVLYAQQSITVHNSSFITGAAFVRSSYSTSSQGGTLWSQGDIIVTSSNISDSQAVGDGGAVYTTHSVILTNTNIVNSESQSGRGGAIYGSDMEITNCSVENARAHSYGGAVWSQGDIIVTSSNISDSQAVGDGGAVYTTHNVILTNTNIVNSDSQSGRGGAIYGSDVTITNCSVENARARGDGGAVYSLQNVMIFNSIISQCSTQNGTGGAVYSAAIIHDTGFNVNSTTPNVFFSGSTFSYNSATSGGVLYTNGYYNHHMEFNNSTFVNNEATDVGGVAFLRNTSLSISNCVFNNNTAGTNAGVLDVSFSSVSIERSLLSDNRAGDNGGVFCGTNYITNFTTVQTVFKHNAATNGGVFYVRRFNSNIKLVDSTLTENHATNQGGVMDIRGVTLTIDSDTVIANNTADMLGNVVSSCLSKINAYGLEVQPDPVYPMYCSHYNEGNSSHISAPEVENDSTSSGTMSTKLTTIEELSVTSQPINTDKTSAQELTTEEDTTTLNNGVNSATFTPTTNSPPISTTVATGGDSKGNLVAHTSTSATTIVSDTTRMQPWTEVATGNSDQSTSTQSNSVTTSTAQKVSTGPGQQSWTDDLTTTPEILTMATTQISTTKLPVTVPMSSTSTKDENQSTTIEHTESTTTELQKETGIPREIDHSTEAISTHQIIPDPLTGAAYSSLTTQQQFSGEVQAEKDKDSAWNSGIFQVAIVSLAVLCTVCIVVCVMMVVLFYIACQRKNITLKPRCHYKKLPLTDKEKEETENEIQEYSFTEI